MSDDRRDEYLRDWLAEDAAGEAPPETAGPPVPARGGIEVLLQTLPAAGAEASWAPGTQIGRYVVVRAIGEGGMGAVYEAQDTKLKRKVAVKRLRSVRALHAVEARDRLLREAQALAQVSHPAVVHVYDCDLLSDAVYLVMEYVDGQRLRQWLQAERGIGEIVALFKGIGAGLAAAHAVGLVHRDFKPDNVMVDRYGRPRVLDFGLACAMSEHQVAADPAFDGDWVHPSLVGAQLTMAGLLVGTPQYMAPEQVMGRPAGPHSDQFSFCVCLYEALAGERPFGGTSQRELFDEIRHKTPVLRGAAIPDPLRKLIAIGLAKRPEERFTNMVHLLATLDAIRLDAIPLAAMTSADRAPSTPEPAVPTTTTPIALAPSTPAAPGKRPLWLAPLAAFVAAALLALVIAVAPTFRAPAILPSRTPATIVGRLTPCATSTQCGDPHRWTCRPATPTGADAYCLPLPP